MHEAGGDVHPVSGGKNALPPATLVIGLGNPLRGDDGVGVRVAHLLATQPLPPIVNQIEGRRRVVFVDAADVGRSPGEFACFSLDEAQLLGDDRHLTIHAAGLRDALLLGQALDILPEEIIIFGVQPANLEWDSALSPEVEAILPKLIAAVLEETADRGRRSTVETTRN
jgi:hydrogenase maturation protease